MTRLISTRTLNSDFPTLYKQELEEFQNRNTCYFDSDFIFDDIKSQCKIFGLEIDKIYYSGFCGQGDGASFEGSYTYFKNWKKNS